jgi:photosystem II stability/assembly factor-like uncharacterized protein
MSKHIKLLFLFAGIIISSYGQQDLLPTNMQSSSRYDDVFFINASTGWAVGGNPPQILYTKDSGAAWEVQFSPGKYLRSIEFATPQRGFCGSLDSTLYKTIDGGITWTDITHLVKPRPAGICGLSAPDPLTIYGCGIWRSPAFIIKSVDGGQTWAYTDMSAYATNLVDIYFINKDTGFVTGTANPVSEGGIVLYTADGGKTWLVKYKTQVAEDYVWKIQSPDNVHFFGSVSSLPPASNIRMLKSNDKGMSWATVLVNNIYDGNIQMVGFLNNTTGWTGGWGNLYKTTDGGQTWSQPFFPYPKAFNRFFRVNDSIAYLSNNRIYRYPAPNMPPVINTPVEQHTLLVSPNPTNGSTRAKIIFANNTFASLALYNSDGKNLQRFIHGYITKGIHTIDFNLTGYPGSAYFLVLRTDEGITHQKIVKITK